MQLTCYMHDMCIYLLKTKQLLIYQILSIRKQMLVFVISNSAYLTSVDSKYRWNLGWKILCTSIDYRQKGIWSRWDLIKGKVHLLTLLVGSIHQWCLGKFDLRYWSPFRKCLVTLWIPHRSQSEGGPLDVHIYIVVVMRNSRKAEWALLNKISGWYAGVTKHHLYISLKKLLYAEQSHISKDMVTKRAPPSVSPLCFLTCYHLMLALKGLLFHSTLFKTMYTMYHFRV